MAYEQKPGQASLFKNDKGGVETRPDYTGTGMTPDGREVKLSAWVKRPQGKDPYMSISIQYKEQQAAPAATPMKVTPLTAEVVKDDLPY
jgi:hypothetical protein